jgi:hypothetical protein
MVLGLTGESESMPMLNRKPLRKSANQRGTEKPSKGLTLGGEIARLNGSQEEQGSLDYDNSHQRVNG